MDADDDEPGRVDAARSTASLARLRLKALSNEVEPSCTKAMVVFCSERVGAVDILTLALLQHSCQGM